MRNIARTARLIVRMLHAGKDLVKIQHGRLPCRLHTRVDAGQSVQVETAVLIRSRAITEMVD